MALINIMEDIVDTIVTQVINNDKTLAIDTVNKDDITAYVLNRITPRYVTGERGFLHGTIETRQHTQKKSDILFLIYEAIDIIKSRRNSSGNDMPKTKKMIFPHIVGEVLEETTFSTVSDVTVTLLFEGKKVPMIDSGWMNPYITRKATRGYYHFWPAYDKTIAGNKKHINFTIKCEHPKFETKEETISVNISEDKTINTSFIAPIILISAREGVDVDFLYS